MPSASRIPKITSTMGIKYDKIFELFELKKSNDSKVYLNASTFESLRIPETMNINPIKILRAGFIYLTKLGFGLFIFSPKIYVLLKQIFDLKYFSTLY